MYASEPSDSRNLSLASHVRHATGVRPPVSVGYARVYARPSAYAAEVKTLQRVGCARVFGDEVSGPAVIRSGLEQALADLRQGDCLVVISLERLAWRHDDLIDLLSAVAQRQAGIRSLMDGLDTRSADTDTFIRALARYAGDVAASRAIEAGRSDPRQKLTPLMVASARTALASGVKTVPQIAAELGVNRSTLYRRVGAHA